ncbi:hypothetical protein [Photobacterium damselae]|uniref:hypothetical protein n=1 Tax=Photobacterium damselae TaxID=38293 RepID=UPI004069513A
MSQSTRIELVKNSLLKNPTSLDKSLYAIVDSFNAEEWAEVIKMKGKNLPFYNSIIPFFAYTFKPEIADEMISNKLITTNTCGESLSDALFFALSNGSQIESEQPTFVDICNTPILLNLFNGSILNRISRAEFSDDISDYFRDKFKKMLKSFNDNVLISNEIDMTPELALTGNNKFRSINDVDEESIEDTLQIIYFLQATNSLASSLNVTELNEDLAQMISTLQFQKIIRDSSNSKKEERSRLKQLESSLAYIMGCVESESCYESIIAKLNPMMFDKVETSILSAIFAINTTSAESDLKEESLTTDSLYVDENSLLNEPNESIFKKIAGKIWGNDSCVETQELQDASHEQVRSDEVAINNVLIKTKKSKTKFGVIIFGLIIAILMGYFLASQAHSKIEQQSSVISNVQGGASSQYPVIKVTNH